MNRGDRRMARQTYPFSLLSEEAKQKAISIISGNNLFASWDVIREEIRQSIQSELEKRIGYSEFKFGWYYPYDRVTMTNFSVYIPDECMKEHVSEEDYRMFKDMEKANQKTAVVQRRMSGAYSVILDFLYQENEQETELDVLKRWIQFFREYKSFYVSEFEEMYKNERYRMRLSHEKRLTEENQGKLYRRLEMLSEPLCQRIAEGYQVEYDQLKKMTVSIIEKELKKFESDDLIRRYLECQITLTDPHAYTYTKEGYVWANGELLDCVIQKREG